MMKQTSSTGKGHAAVRAALAKIIHLHNDFPAMLREGKDGCSSTEKGIITIGNHMASNVDNIGKKEIRGKESKIIHRSEQPGNEILNKEEVYTDINDATYEGLSSITKKVILEQIEVEAESLGIEVSVAAKSMVLAQVKLLARQIQDGEDFHSDMEGLISTTHFLISRKILATTDVGEHLLKENAFCNLPLTSLWRFSCIGVVSVEQIIKCIHDSKPTNLSLVDDLLQLVLYKKKDHMSTSAVSGILGVLIGIAYDLASEKYLSLCRFANDVLNSLTTKLIDHILENRSENNVGKEKFNDNEDIHMHTKGSQEETKNVYSNDSETREIPIMNIYGMVLNNLNVTSEAMESYCSAQLLHILTHRPNLQLGRVLRKQEKWRSTQADTTLSALIQKLVIALGHEAALNTLDLVVTNDEVNWSCVLTLVATALNCHRATATALKGMIDRKIRRGCEDQEMDLLIIGFLFARHASQEGRHIFPSYPQWFSSLFATESGSPASNKQAFVFLVRFLSDLVPHEPAYCLRAHLTSHIFTPKGCQEVLRDYYYLVRARLQELKDSLNPSDSQQSSRISSKVVEEVEAAVNHFSETGKIPNFILEASIFRKPYFCSAFLPALLVARPIPDVPDARAKLIGALHSAGKIPSNMFNNYIEACQKEVSDLLADVFMNNQEDVIEEPITELSNMLQELVNHSSNSQGRDEASSSMVLPVLSQISQKIEEIMKINDSRIKNISCIIINVRTFNAKLITYQVVEKIIGIVERLCFTSYPEGNTKERRPSWLTQFVSLLSSSITLQQALFTYLVHTLERGQHGAIAPDQIKKCGIMLSEIWRIEGFFLPVTEASTPNQEPLPFTHFFLNKLELSSQQAFVFACSIMNNWLKWYLLSEDDAAAGEPSLYSLPTQLLDMYCCLAPRLPLICNHQSEREVTVADVYSYLDGNNVPECSRLYFTHICKYGEKHKVSLENWVIFELKATWVNTPIDVRQTYLKSRVLQDFASPTTVASDCQQEMVTAGNSTSTTNDRVSLSNIVVQIVFALLKIGLNQQNSNEILMLIQSLAQHIPDSSICLLQEWHKRFTEGIVHDTSVLTFISICRCLPPSFFLRADQLLQVSGVLRSLVDQLVVTSQGIQPSVCDTVFLCSALLNAAARPGVKNLQVQQCLTSLRIPIVFHWELLRSFFKNYNAVISNHCCLENLWNTLNTPSKKNVSSLTPEESGIRLLALCLQQSLSEEELRDMVSVVDEPMYLKWLLAYIGLQQMRGSVPLFPSDKELLLGVKKQDKRTILLCQEELHKVLAVSDTSKIINKIFPRSEEKHLPLKSVPVACVMILLLNFIKPCDKRKGKEINKELAVINQFDLLLQCHIFLSNIYDCKGSSDEDSFLCRNSLSRMGNSESPELEYLAKLNQKIFSLLSKISTKILAKVSKSTFSRCDNELKAAIKFKLQTS